MDLELWEVILVERSLHHLDGWDLSVELGKIHVRMNGINSERVTQFGDYHSMLWGFSMPWSTWACSPSRTFSNSQSQLEMSCRWLVSFWSACKKC
jgi:hypothetical protein